MYLIRVKESFYQEGSVEIEWNPQVLDVLVYKQFCRFVNIVCRATWGGEGMHHSGTYC